MNTLLFNRPVAKWAAIGGLSVLALTGAAWMGEGALSRMARERAIRGIQESFASELEVKSLNVSVFPRLRMTGEGLVLHYKGRKDLPPLISIRKFTAQSSLAALLMRHVRHVELEGLEIQVPPKSQRAPHEKRNEKRKQTQKIAGFVIDTIVADGTILKTLPKNPSKEPLEWDIRRLTLHGAGPSSPMSFKATLVNAKPPGDIESTGTFGPWDREEPGDTPVQGNYTFQNADLSVFKGISGMLSSTGTYHGVLGRIEVKGNTDTPDFTVKVSGNPVHLKTQFEAVVDGTDGDTLLQPVNAQFERTSVVAQGGVEGTKGVKGKTVSLDVTVKDGRLEDLLRLGVKERNPTMTGSVGFRAKLVIPPGDVDIAEKMKLDGEFTIGSAHFSRSDLQTKVNQLSHRGKGDPEAPPTDTVASNFGGHFTLDNGVMTFRSLSFQIPGVSIALNGKYGLVDEQIDFRGTAKLEAKVSETTTGIKSFLLKVVDPFFQKKEAGAVIPIKITGPRKKPSFGLDMRPGK